MEATSLFLAERQMDHVLSTTAADPVGGMMELVCFASGPGLTEAQRTARDLRCAISGAFVGGPWQPDCIRHLEVVPSTEAEFQAARAALADKVCDESVFRLIVHCGVAAMGAARNCRASRRDGRASGEKRRRTDWHGLAVQDIPPADAEGPFLPPEAGRQPAAPLASYAGVVEDLPPTEFGALAAAVSEQHAALKASFQPPMNSERVLEVAKTGLVLLEAVGPLLANLARCVDDVSQRLVASATDEGFRAATHDALLALRRAHATAHPRRDRPGPRAARHTPATPGKDGSTPARRRLQRRRQATQAADHLVLPAARAAAAGQDHGDGANQSRRRRHRPQQP